MNLELVPCAYLKYAKKVVLSKQYIIILTGQAIIVLDKNRTFVKRIEGLKYAYNGQLSPDETQLLVISNTSEFYIFSLETLEITARCKPKGNISVNEGRGCWSPDGKDIFLILIDNKKFSYFLRIYPVGDFKNYTDMRSIGDMLCFFHILSLPSEDAIYVLAQSRECEWTNTKPTSFVLLCIKGDQVNKYEIPNQNDIPLSMEYNEVAKRFVIYTLEQTFTCDLDGGNVRVVDTGHDAPMSRANFFTQPFVARQILESQNHKHLFMASNFGLEIFDKQTGEPLCFKEFSFGLVNITEIEENLIVVGTYGGTSQLYRLLE